MQESNTVWINMYVPLINILFERSKEFRSRMSEYTHVLVDEVQARLTPLSTLCACALLRVALTHTFHTATRFLTLVYDYSCTGLA